MPDFDQTPVYLDAVDRCAIALGHTLNAREWETVWHNRREIGPYSVLVELKIVSAERLIFAGDIA